MKAQVVSKWVRRRKRWGVAVALIAAEAIGASQATAQFAAIQGRISTEGGERVRGLKVHVRLSGKQAEKYSADVDDVTNEFLIQRVQPGTYDVAFCAGFAYTPVLVKGLKVEAGDTPTKVPVAMSLQVTAGYDDFVKLEGVAVQGAAVRIVHTETGCVFYTTKTACDGSFHVRVPDSKSYFVDKTYVSDGDVVKSCRNHSGLFLTPKRGPNPEPSAEVSIHLDSRDFGQPTALPMPAWRWAFCY